MAFALPNNSRKSTAESGGDARVVSVGGLVLLDKPEGISSFQCLGRIKRVLGTRRVGHVGTLDPFAGGLLGAVTQRATRLARLLSGLEKRYLVTIRFGRETDTLDPEGRVIHEAPVPDLERVQRALPGLRGQLRQRPPEYSAIHVDGQRAYALARRGQQPDLAVREVTVAAADVLHWSAPDLTVAVTCSAGTYIRAWARDLGRAAGSCAYVVQLRRTAIGPFSTNEAVLPEQFCVADVLPPTRFLSRLPNVQRLQVLPQFRHGLVRGQAVRADYFASAPQPGACYYAAFDVDECLLALLRWQRDGWSYAGVFADG